ncbi:MAG: PrgI family protein [Eubacteriales bacterium]
MAYVSVPKDLSNVKTKVMFNLTKRQLICFSIAGAIGVPIFLATKDTIGTNVAVLLMMAIMFPFFMLAMYEKYNQPLEVILKNYYNVKFGSSHQRPYMTDNFYQLLEQQDKLDKEVEVIVKQTQSKTGKVRTKSSNTSSKKGKK